MKGAGMIRNLCMALIAIGLTGGIASAQFVANVSKVATTAAPFLTIGVGARAVGMGGAFVATASDASALYWNPGGLARLERPETLIMHTQWLADMSFNYAGLVVPIGRFGALGMSVTTLTMPDMLVRTVEQPDGTGERFSANDLALQLSYGISLTDRFSIGFNAKYVHQQIWKERASGFAIDIGTLFTTGLKGMRIGATLSNFGTDMKLAGEDLLVFYDVDPKKAGNNDRVFADLKTDRWPLPLSFQVGVALEAFENENNRLTLALDAVNPTDNTESLNLGMEYAFRELFFLRAGYRDLFLRDGEQGLTVGAGMVARFLGNVALQLDYAYADFGRLENVQRFAVRILF